MNNDAPAAKVSAYELWRKAGGGTKLFDRAEYRRLMLHNGLIRELEPGETAEPLPCGWPNRRNAEQVDPDAVRPMDDAVAQDEPAGFWDREWDS